MKWILPILLLVCVRVSGADQVTLAWDASPSGGVAAYRLQYGTNAAALSYLTNVGLVRTQTVAVPFRGRWFFAVKAVDTNGLVSVFSNVVQWESPPVPPVMNGEQWVRLTPVIERSPTRQTGSARLACRRGCQRQTHRSFSPRGN